MTIKKQTKQYKGITSINKSYKQEGHDGPVLLHWLICKILSYQTLKQLGIDLNLRPLRRTKIGSHEFYQEDFERFHYINLCKTSYSWQSIRPGL